MERESNQLEAGPILCRTGCGFFGSSNTDGLCSKCYKDALKKKQQPPSTSVTSPTSNSSTCGSSSSPSPSPMINSASLSSSLSSAAAAATAQPTIPSLLQSLNSADFEKASDCSSHFEAHSIAESEASSPESEGSKKKKNKCLTCKKKVGLTGFTCRCGGLYCSVHRYSNEHRCTFDYRELGAEEIRRNNPVVKGEKIQKI